MSEKAGPGCFLCEALRSSEDRERLVVLRGRWNFVLLNRYPYNNGHLMVVPNRHLATLSASSDEELHELIALTVKCERALRAAYRPDGLNLGANLGKSAGAGVEDHYHVHIVPRWRGDTNFMSVTSETRLIPEGLDRTWERVSEALKRLAEGAA